MSVLCEKDMPSERGVKQRGDLSRKNAFAHMQNWRGVAERGNEGACYDNLSRELEKRG